MKQLFTLTGNEIIQAVLLYLVRMKAIQEKDGCTLRGTAQVPESVTFEISYINLVVAPAPEKFVEGRQIETEGVVESIQIETEGEKNE